MCKTFSALGLRDGSLYWRPDVTDSHEDLINDLGIDDTGADDNARTFVRLEFVPRDDKYDDVDSYDIRVDEISRPVWVSDDMLEQWAADLRARVGRMIIRDGVHKVLLGGCWIVCGTAYAKRAKSCRIIGVSGSASIDGVYDSARIDRVHDSARIGDVYDSARIGDVYGSARIGDVYGSARIDGVYDSARIDSVYGSARIGGVYGSARIDSVYGSARIDSVSGSARIDSVSGSARIDSVSGSARIANDYRSKTNEPA